MHMVAHGGRNDKLFIGAVVESIFFPAQPFVSELEYQFERVVRQTGCNRLARSKQMACLRSKKAASLQAANFAQPFPGRSQPPMPLFYWTPCIDGVFLQDLPYNLFKRGQFIDVPVLFGTDTDGTNHSLLVPCEQPLISQQKVLSSLPTPPPLPPWLPSSQTTTPNSPPPTRPLFSPATPILFPPYHSMRPGSPRPASPTAKPPLSAPALMSSTSCTPTPPASPTGTTYRTTKMRLPAWACRTCLRRPPYLAQIISADMRDRAIARIMRLWYPWLWRIGLVLSARWTRIRIENGIAPCGEDGVVQGGSSGWY